MLKSEEDLHLVYEAEICVRVVVFSQVRPHLLGIRKRGDLSKHGFRHQLNNNEQGLLH